MDGESFVALYYNQEQNHLVQHTRTFTLDDSDSLHDYAIYVTLDDLIKD